MCFQFFTHQVKKCYFPKKGLFVGLDDTYNYFCCLKILFEIIILLIFGRKEIFIALQLVTTPFWDTSFYLNITKKKCPNNEIFKLTLKFGRLCYLQCSKIKKQILLQEITKKKIFIWLRLFLKKPFFLS